MDGENENDEEFDDNDEDDAIQCNWDNGDEAHH